MDIDGVLFHLSPYHLIIIINLCYSNAFSQARGFFIYKINTIIVHILMVFYFRMSDSIQPMERDVN